MAVVDKYPANLENGDVAYVHAAQAQGAVLVHLVQDIEVAAADDNDSVYRLFRNIPASFIPVKMDIECDAITSGNDWNVGIYKPNLGTVISENALADALDLSSAVKGYTSKNGLNAVAIEDVGQKSLMEIAAETLGDNQPMYDIGLKGVAVGSAAGTIVAHLWGHVQ